MNHYEQIPKLVFTESQTFQTPPGGIRLRTRKGEVLLWHAATCMYLSCNGLSASLKRHACAENCNTKLLWCTIPQKFDHALEHFLNVEQPRRTKLCSLFAKHLVLWTLYSNMRKNRLLKKNKKNKKQRKTFLSLIVIQEYQ